MLACISQRIKGTAAYQRYKHSRAYVTLKELAEGPAAEVTSEASLATQRAASSLPT
jgi:hypothetical protein